jgi:hypothetical protein
MGRRHLTTLQPFKPFVQRPSLHGAPILDSKEAGKGGVTCLSSLGPSRLGAGSG